MEQKILELHKKGISSIGISIRLNISVSAVSKVLVKNGIHSKKKLDIKYEDLYRLYIEEEKSTKDIAKIYSCVHSTINRKLHEFNIPTRSKEESKELATRQGKNTLQNQMKRRWENGQTRDF